jgi:mannitol/fructose-specific phosphotransferase system IIA component (Ntr-type)
MKLQDFLVADATMDDLQAVDKAGVVKEMVKKLVDAGRLGEKQAKAAVQAILDREALGSTGIGRGIAVPHAKHASVKQIVGCLGRSKKGIQFAAIDGEPVYLVFLLLSPIDQPGPHLKALEHISVVLRDENFSRFLRRAKDKEELISLLAEADEKLYRG